MALVKWFSVPLLREWIKALTATVVHAITFHYNSYIALVLPVP